MGRHVHDFREGLERSNRNLIGSGVYVCRCGEPGHPITERRIQVLRQRTNARKGN